MGVVANWVGCVTWLGGSAARSIESARTVAMSSLTNGAPDARIRPEITATGTSARTLACSPIASEAVPITGRTKATPGIANSDMVVNAAERTRGPVSR